MRRSPFAAPGEAAEPAGDPVLARRALLATALLPAAADTACASPPTTPTLLVPGPEEGHAVRWAARLAQRIGRVSPSLGAPRLTVLGGPDGVTAANRFGTAEPGDGRVLLVLTGGAVRAFLSGAERARYQPVGWLPLCASWGGILVAGRGSMADAVARGEPLRSLRPTADAPEAAALLAIEALGLPTLLVPALPEAAEGAFLGNALDVLLLSGPGAGARARSLGATPWFGFGLQGGETPDYAALAPAVPLPLQRAVRAAAGASQLRGALLLPTLTSADVVAMWRQAALRWREGELVDPNQVEGEPLTGQDAALAMAALSPPPDAVLAWRGWLQTRLGWQPD